MATKFDNTLQMTNSTDALFRAWVQFIHDLFITTGAWVDPGDAGQLVIAGAAHPTLANTKVGFRIYRMNDSLAGASPVFVRLDFGSGAAANSPSVWVTIGTASNNAGTLTGVIFNGGATVAPTLSAGTSGLNACNSYGSADTGRVHFLLFPRTGGADQMLLSIERSVDSTGTPTGDGLIYIYGTGSTPAGRVDVSGYLVRAGGSQPPSESGLHVTLSNRSASAFTGDVGVGVPIVYKSIAQQPGTGVIVVNDGDFVAQGQPSFTFYGVTRTYQLGESNANSYSVPLGNITSTNSTNRRIGIRFD